MGYATKVAISIVIFMLSVSAVPIYNNLIFSGEHFGELGKFPYPIATAFLQLGTVCIVLSIGTIVVHLASPDARLRGNSWLLGPHFGYKFRHIAPVGFLFGFKYGISNLGLAQVDTGVHLLLQSTDIVWTTFFACIVNKERPGPLELVAVFFSLLGSACVSMREAQRFNGLHAAFIPLLVNLITPVSLALCTTTLRQGAKELLRDDNCLRGTMTSFEFTAIKMACSAIGAFLLAMYFEGGGEVQKATGLAEDAWWVALGDRPALGTVLVLLGSLFVLIFQVNITWLSALTSAVSVGICSGVKVLPQWILNAMFQLKVDLTFLNVTGAAIMFAASLLYTWAINYDYRAAVRAWTKADLRENLL